MKGNSFVFHTEWKDILKEYREEVRLEVYEALIEYATSGTLIELKPLSKMAFAFIKQQIDKDRENIETISEKRRKAGQKGAQKRWSKVKKKQTTPAPPHTQQQVSTSSSSPRSPLVRPSSDPSDWSDKSDKSSSSSSSDRSAPSDKSIITTTLLDKEIQELKSAQIWLDNLQTQHRIPTNDLIKKLDEFKQHCLADGKESHPNINEAKRHFNNWLRIVNKNGTTNRQTPNTKNQRIAELQQWVANKLTPK